MNTVGQNIRSLRQKKGWSQTEAAVKLNISTPAFSKIETNITDISVRRLKQIAELFEVDVTALLCETGMDTGSLLRKQTEIYKSEVSKLKDQVVSLQSKVIDLYEQLESK